MHCALHVVEYGQGVEVAGGPVQFVGRTIPVKYDVPSQSLNMEDGVQECRSHFVQDSSEVQVVILRCHTLNNNFLKVSCQLESLFHFCHPGKKRLRKHTCQSTSLMFGSVASNNKKRGCPLLIISIQFCLGTVVRTLRCRREGSYVPL